MVNPTLINIAVPCVILDASETVSAGAKFALPTRTCNLSAQVDLDEDQAFTLLIQVSIDGLTWTTLETITAAEVTGITGLFLLDPVSAVFIRANVTVNATPIAITVTILAKVANP